MRRTYPCALTSILVGPSMSLADIQSQTGGRHVCKSHKWIADMQLWTHGRHAAVGGWHTCSSHQQWEPCSSHVHLRSLLTQNELQQQREGSGNTHVKEGAAPVRSTCLTGAVPAPELVPYLPALPRRPAAVLSPDGLPLYLACSSWMACSQKPTLCSSTASTRTTPYKTSPA